MSDWDSFMGLSDRPYSQSRAHSVAGAGGSTALRSFKRTPYASRPNYAQLLSSPRGRQLSGEGGTAEGDDAGRGTATAAVALFGPMKHERPPQVATAVGAAAMRALSAHRPPDRPAERPAEAAGQASAAPAPRSSLTASTVLRFVDQMATVQPPTETEAVVSSVMERMVELVSLRCAGLERGDLGALLDEQQSACFAAEQKQAEQQRVAGKVKKMLSSSRRAAGAGRGGAAPGSQRARLAQAQAAAAWMKRAEARRGDGSVALAEEAPASAGCLHRRPFSGSAVPSSAAKAASKRRPKSDRQPGPPRAGRGGGGGARADSGPMRGLVFGSRRTSDGNGSGHSAASDFSYPGFAYATGNFYTIAGCGSEAVQKRVLDVVRRQNETVKNERMRRRPKAASGADDS
eukprot:jgi/Tetstr1/434735/TSEL_023787.t1